jgi:hypothetical protein
VSTCRSDWRCAGDLSMIPISCPDGIGAFDLQHPPKIPAHCSRAMACSAPDMA